MSDASERRDRALGCWWGQMAGDALGSMVEFSHPGDLAARYPDGLRDMGASPVWGTAAGQLTDDSEMAVELLHALPADGDYVDGDAVARGYVRWFDSRPFDMGNTIGTVLRAAAGAPGRENMAAVMRQHTSLVSQANGALMRESVLGIWGTGVAPATLGALAREDARLTHPHPVCLDASAVYVATLAHIIQHGGTGRDAYAFAEAYQREFGSEAAVTRCLEQAAEEVPPISHHTGYVLTALHNAFFQGLHATDSEAAITATVMLGGDTDTNAAIAGALAGAVYGEADIPLRWRQTLQACRFSGQTVRPDRYLPRNAHAAVVALVGARMNP